MKKVKLLVKKLTELGLTISTMESCTGGGVANDITNIEGASEVLNFSAVTYSNKFKIKMGVSSEVIEKYSVYSMETAMEMSKSISNYTDSNYGIGITGKLNKIDKNNLSKNNDTVYISIYNKIKNQFYNEIISVKSDSKKENKKQIIVFVIDKLLSIL